MGLPATASAPLGPSAHPGLGEENADSQAGQASTPPHLEPRQGHLPSPTGSVRLGDTRSMGGIPVEEATKGPLSPPGPT